MNYERISLIFSNYIAELIGSWKFIIAQSFTLFVWILFNAYHSYVFDPYPFILLNLILSFQAAYTGPILLMASNRQAHLDRRRDIENLRLQKRIYEVVLMLDAHNAQINLIEIAKINKSSKV